MTKLQIAELHKLSTKDKIKVVQTLWDDIANENTFDTLSSEHKKILDDRMKVIDSGNASFKSWSDVQQKFRNIQ